MKKKKLFFPVLFISAFLALTGCSGLQGPAGPQGPQGEPGIQGPAGENGLNGVNGIDGITIISIERIGEGYDSDKYQINYSDGTSTTFYVYKGVDGEPGIQGEPGKDGHTPEIKIGTNGNWFVDGEDTGVKAQGPQGDTGKSGVSVVSITKTSSEGLVDTYTITYSDWSTSTFTITNGANGSQGIQGKPGKDGHTPVISIGSNGNWFVDGADTGVKAQGPKGDKGDKGDTGPAGQNGVSVVSIIKVSSNGLIDTYEITYSNGEKTTFTITNGADGQTGAAGVTGADGHTPEISINQNGNWAVDGVDTGIKAQGPKGDQGDKGDTGPAGQNGVSVVSIVKTSSNGLVDTYTITYSNGETSTFTITNGENGEQGIQGEPGADGHTPTITIGANGNWLIDGVDSGIKAQGPKGDKGDQGETGVSVVSTTIDENGDLIVTFSDGTTQNAGHVKDVNIYTVKFYIGDEVVATRTVPAYSKVARPTEDEIAGYRVEYWYTKDGDYKDRWNFQGCVVTEDINIYAMYQPAQYVISFVDSKFNNAVPNYTREYNQAYTLPTLSETGYQFLGWYDANGNKMNNTGTYRIPHDLTLYARWAANTYQVRLCLNGGEINSSTADVIITVTYGQPYTLPTPTRYGLAFVGWYNGDNQVPSQSTWLTTSGMTLLAQWASTRTYTLNSGASSTGIIDMTISFGDTYELPIPELPDGYKFDGWYIGDQTGTYIPRTGTWDYVGPDTTLVAHYYDDWLTYDEYANSCTLTDYWNKSDWAVKSIVIPGHIHGKRTQLMGGFYSQYGLQFVTFEEGCYYIRIRTFRSCYNLTRIEIPASMETIETTSDGYAFSGCYKLVSIINHSSINITLGEGTINGNITQHAREIVRDVSQSKLYIDSQDFVHYLDNGEDTLINWVGKVVLDENKKSKATIPSGVTKIEHDAFFYCYSSSGPFHEITIPTSVKEIGDDAFYAPGSARLTVINYQGTKAQWAQVSLPSRWVNTSYAKVVHCIDGDVDIVNS